MRHAHSLAVADLGRLPRAAGYTEAFRAMMAWATRKWPRVGAGPSFAAAEAGGWRSGDAREEALAL
jgi:hypothetical protein